MNFKAFYLLFFFKGPAKLHRVIKHIENESIKKILDDNLKQTKLKYLKMTKAEIKIIIEENNINIYKSA